MAGAASQAGDADSSRAPGLTSGLQGSVNVHRGALLLVPLWQCISSFTLNMNAIMLVDFIQWSVTKFYFSTTACAADPKFTRRYVSRQDDIYQRHAKLQCIKVTESHVGVRKLSMSPSGRHFSWQSFMALFCVVTTSGFSYKINGKSSDAVVWQTPINDRHCRSKLHKDATKTFYYTTITDRLKTVGWSDSSNWTGVLKSKLKDTTFPQPLCNQMDKNLKYIY